MNKKRVWNKCKTCGKKRHRHKFPLSKKGYLCGSECIECGGKRYEAKIAKAKERKATQRSKRARRAKNERRRIALKQREELRRGFMEQLKGAVHRHCTISESEYHKAIESTAEPNHFFWEWLASGTDLEYTEYIKQTIKQAA